MATLPTQPPATNWDRPASPVSAPTFSVAPPAERMRPAPATSAPAASTRPTPPAATVATAPQQQPPAAQPPAAQPQMMPAYLAKAMERQRAKEAKENELVAVPQSTAAPQSTAVPQSTAAPQTQQPQPTTAEPAPPQQQAAAPAPPAQQQQQVAATQEQAATTDQTFNDLLEQAKQWMAATEDPATKARAAQLMIQSALDSEQAMNAAKMQISQNPALVGQPAGQALLALRASQLGMQTAELEAAMNIEELRRVAELNRLGFDATMRLNEIRKTEEQRDLENYGSVLDEMIRGGADEQTLKTYFDDFIKPLLPNGGAGLTLDQFRNPATRLSMLQGQRDESARIFREAVARGDDITTLRQMISANWDETQLAQMGSEWLEGKSIDDVNAALESAGIGPVDDLSELIGNEDLIGEATLINRAREEANRAPYQDIVDDTLRMLIDSGVEFTPEMENDVRAYIIASELGDDTAVPPWMNDATGHLYNTWPLPGQANFTRGTLSDGEASAHIYQRNEALNRAWESYLSSTPADQRLTREAWYGALVKDNPGIADGRVVASEIPDVVAAWSAPKKKIEYGDREEAKANLGKDLAAATNKLDFAMQNIDALVGLDMVKNFTSPADMPTTDAGWDALKADGTGNEQGVVKIGEKVYQIFQEGGKVTEQTSVGKVVKLIGADERMYVMKVNSGGKYNIPVGVLIPYDEKAGATESFRAAGMMPDERPRIVGTGGRN